MVIRIRAIMGKVANFDEARFRDLIGDIVERLYTRLDFYLNFAR